METKIYYTIGEVSKFLDVPDYVIRYWEKEFDNLSPDKRRGGKRLYKQKDIENLQQVKHYLYDQKYTIEGAKKIFGSKRKNHPTQQDNASNTLFSSISNNSEKNSSSSVIYNQSNTKGSQIIEEVKNDLRDFLNKL